MQSNTQQHAKIQHPQRKAPTGSKNAYTQKGYSTAPKTSIQQAPVAKPAASAEYLNPNSDLLVGFESSYEVIHSYLNGHPQVCEFFNQLLDETGLNEAPLKNTVQHILVSGSSLVASGLATSLAKEGQRVAIIECGFTETEIQKVFNTRADQGLSELFTERADLESLVINARVFKPSKGLFLFHQGQFQINWAEQAGRIRSLIRAISPKFHRIIINVPNLSENPQIMRWAQTLPSQLILHYEDEQDTQSVENTFRGKHLQIL